MKLISAFIMSCLLVQQTFAADGYTGAAEAGAIVLSGNTESESYNLKSANKYTTGANIFAVGGEYVNTKLAGTNSKKWEATGRYERSLTDIISGFAQQKADSDEASGYTQKDSTSAGLKYFFIKEDAQNLFSELSYRSTNTRANGVTDTTPYADLYLEFNKAVDKTLSYKLWAMYSPNLKSGMSEYSETKYEASLSVALSDMFSMKTAYNVKRQNKVVSPIKNDDTKFTTSLVANF